VSGLDNRPISSSKRATQPTEEEERGKGRKYASKRLALGAREGDDQKRKREKKIVAVAAHDHSTPLANC